MRYCYNCFQSMPDGATVCPSCGYNASAQTGKFPMALPPGTVLNGRYILGRVLGQGGFGITYIAQDHKTGVLVAVKEYFPDTMAARTDGHSVSAYTGQREENFLYGKECFLNEAKTLAEFIGNPNIVRVHSYFEENNTAYFVMDYVQGTSFQDYLKQHGRLSWQETKRILEPVIGALASVHSKGVIHRDVTPDNIYITNDGTVKLLDFGAARYSLGDKSRSLDVVLKHGYAPREQYSRHGRQGPYTDVYALGATFYYALTGRLPPDSIDRQDEDEFILPSSLGVKLPAKAEDALCKALAVSAQDRFQSMSEFYLALNEGDEEPMPPTPPVPPWPRPSGDERENGKSTGGEKEQPSPSPQKERERGDTPPSPTPPSPVEDNGNDSQKASFLQEKLAAFRTRLGQMEPKKKRSFFIGIGAGGTALLLALVVILVNILGQDSSAIVDVPVDLTVRTTFAEVADGTGGMVVLEEEYDADGNLLKTSGFDEAGQEVFRREYGYDDKGHNISEVKTAGGSLDWKITRRYNGEGYLIEETTVWDDGEKDTVRFTYDNQGNLIKRDDGQGDWTKYEYNDSGYMTKELDYDDDDELSSYSEYEYDEDGNCVQKMYYYADGTVNDGVSYTAQYDKYGNCTEKLYRDGDFICYAHTYDKQGRLLRTECYEKNSLQIVEEYFWDGQEPTPLEDSLLDEESGQAEGSSSSQAALDEDVLAPASDTEMVSLEIRKTYYDETGAIEDYETYEYDDWGNRLRHSYFLANGTADRYYQYVYDTQGNEIESRRYDGDGTPSSWDESTYDENGCQLTSVSYDEDGAVMWRWEYEYDTSGNKVKSLYYDDGEDTLSGWSEYKYDSQGNEVERRDYDENDVLENVARREYDEAGNEVLFQYYDGEEELDSWTEYEYDDQGNEISSNGYEADGTLSDWSETAYDDHGYSVSHTWTYSPEEEDSYHTYIYQNEYDEDGYIIRRTCYSDGDLRNVTEYQVREIPTTPGGDPDLVLPAMGPGGPVEDTSSSQAESSQPSGSGGFSGSQHGITGMQYAIEDIQSLEGFQDEYSGLPCGGLVEMFGGPWFLGLYELENSDGGTAVYYSLYDLRGNGLVLPASDELFVPAGGNSGQVGIYQDGDGSYYLLEKQGTSQGAAMYTAYTFHALTEDGPVADGSYFGSSDVNYDTGNEVYIIGDTKTDEAGFQEFLDRFTPVCSMDILGNYTGNVITFEEFLQNYT